jgi:hypothetical protein
MIYNKELKPNPRIYLKIYRIYLKIYRIYLKIRINLKIRIYLKIDLSQMEFEAL